MATAVAVLVELDEPVLVELDDGVPVSLPAPVELDEGATDEKVDELAVCGTELDDGVTVADASLTTAAETQSISPVLASITSGSLYARQTAAFM